MNADLEQNDRELDDHLRFALHDLDDRAHAHVEARARGGAQDRPARKARLVPALAAVAVLMLLITAGWLARPDGWVRPATHQDRTPPSQSRSEAARDKILPDIAALPLSQRVAPIAPLHPGAVTRVAAAEGTWLISHPDVSSIVGQCPDPTPSFNAQGNVNAGGSCVEYTEILLMTPDLSRVIRAYTIADEPAQWLVLTPKALYCGRQGGLGFHDSMVCRIDRSTLKFTVRAFPSSRPGPTDPAAIAADQGADQSILSQPLPGLWTKEKPSTLTGFDQAKLSRGGLQISDWHGRPTVNLDPLTLKPLP
jgi:hypothetical protein